MTPLPSTSDPTSVQVKDWYYARERTKFGPVPFEQLRALISSGEIKPTDMILADGSPRWAEARSIPGLCPVEDLPAPTASRLECFARDLASVQAGLKRPVDLVPELAARFDLRRQHVRARRARFVADLHEVHSLVKKTDPADHISLLAERFDRCREETISQVAEHLAKLPDDDPIKCPISLFETMKFGRLETAHTRVLTWLLDPSQPHGFGTALFTALWEYVTESPFAAPANVVEAVPEKPIRWEGKTGRLDIFLRGMCAAAPWVFVIEAKIDALEGERQLPTYDAWLNAQYVNQPIKRVFLTPLGIKAENAEGWQSLSFVEVASVLRSRLSDLQQAPGYHYLRFYLAAIMKDVCHWSIPVRDAQSCSNPYGVLQYLKQVNADASRKPR